jgi:hypothetical protein
MEGGSRTSPTEKGADDPSLCATTPQGNVTRFSSCRQLRGMERNKLEEQTHLQ